MRVFHINFKRVVPVLFVIGLSIFACKKENKLDGIKLDENVLDSTVKSDFVVLDSIKKVSYYPKRLFIYFTVNKNLLIDPNSLINVEVYRNNEHKFSLPTNNWSSFIDMTVVSGKTYNYSLSFKTRDNTETRKFDLLDITY